MTITTSADIPQAPTMTIEQAQQALAQLDTERAAIETRIATLNSQSEAAKWQLADTSGFEKAIERERRKLERLESRREVIEVSHRNAVNAQQQRQWKEAAFAAFDIRRQVDDITDANAKIQRLLDSNKARIADLQRDANSKLTAVPPTMHDTLFQQWTAQHRAKEF